MLTADVDLPFDAAVIQAAEIIGADDPREILAVLFAESSVMPTAFHNEPGLHCYGINQFCDPPTFKLAVRDQTPASYLALPASVQLLRYVVPFWNSAKTKHGPHVTKNARNLYWLNFLPSTVRPDAPDDYVIPGSRSAALGNPDLARGKDYVTPGDLSRFLVFRQKAEPSRWNELLDRVERAMGLAQLDPKGTLFDPEGGQFFVPQSKPSAVGAGLGLAFLLGGGYLAWRALS
jgi:hypothetical protein